ncbi:MAG TPA: tetratricopeptide repeat protein [Verrucomicrobiae bacterium]|nr:tetratricopeptide repeat protein [Verrucomicrobiae bacterium]
MGDPDPSFGSWRYLQTLLRERFPETDFEVICVAMTAINSHVILPIARECARHDGDLWIIYMGNNEMVGPFGAGTVFGSRAPETGLVRAGLAVKATKTGQLLDSLTQRWGKHTATPRIWSGLNMFKDHQLRYEDPARLQAYENFKKNLEDILRVAGNAGIPVVLSTVGSNLKDCAPFASLHKAGLDENGKVEWDGLYQRGIALESAGDCPAALGCYTQAAVIDPQYAELHFRAGRCQLALSNSPAAAAEFELARDDDTLAFRADTRINQIIKDAAMARTNRGVSFLDADAMLAQNSPAQISGNELFYEHVHLNFSGNYLLGRSFAEQTLKLLPQAILARGKAGWASAEFCDRRLAVSPWDQFRVWQQNYSRVSEPPFTEQLNDVLRAQFYMAKLKEFNSQMTEETRVQSRAAYEEDLALMPEDYLLRENFAQFLDQTGDLPAAVREEQRVTELVPQTPEANYKIGALLVREGKTGDAAGYFSRALAIRSDFVPALDGLGMILANQQKTAEAAGYFAHVIQLNSGYVATYLNWGFMEQSEGKMDQAMAHYHEAAVLQPAGPAAHFYQAVTLMAAHHRDDAISYFRNAVWMDPTFWQARYLLGGELAAEGKIEEAQAQFSEAVRLRPDFARAHLNDGVALAKLGKLDEAVTEFQATLQLNPTNAVARQNLDTAQANIQALKNRGR